jgi:hypothetical protein
MDSNSGVGEFLKMKSASNRGREAVEGEAGAEDHGQNVRPPHGGLQEARQGCAHLRGTLHRRPLRLQVWQLALTESLYLEIVLAVALKFSDWVSFLIRVQRHQQVFAGAAPRSAIEGEAPGFDGCKYIITVFPPLRLICFDLVYSNIVVRQSFLQLKANALRSREKRRNMFLVSTSMGRCSGFRYSSCYSGSQLCLFL